MSTYICPCAACGASVVRGTPHLCRLAEAAQLVDAMARALEHEGHPTRLIPGRGRVVPDATVARVLGLTPDAVAKVRKRGLSPSVREDWMARWVARGGEELCQERVKVAALFVDAAGPYIGRAGVDAWDIDRDARRYTGPSPVVAHPPCQRWGRYAKGGPSAKVPREIGDDDGCFAAAWFAVRTFGGVLEHPEASHAWSRFGMAKPPKSGGWVKADAYGWTCCVEQGHYGHAARKATWLYAVGTALPELRWGPCEGRTRLEPGFHNRAEALAARARADWTPPKRLTANERLWTPPEFADVLLEMARSVSPQMSLVRPCSGD